MLPAINVKLRWCIITSFFEPDLTADTFYRIYCLVKHLAIKMPVNSICQICVTSLHSIKEQSSLQDGSGSGGSPQVFS